MKLSEVVKSINKKTGAVRSDDTDLTKVTDWLSSGSYAINRALTGDIYKGFPQGRISVIYGPSGSGKSLILANTICSAIKNNQVDVVYYVDTEGGGLWEYMDAQGVDRKKIMYLTAASVNECKMHLTTVYDELDQAAKDYAKDPDNNDKVRALVVLDSFGMLGNDKTITDITEKGKIVSDMGVSAKSKNEMMSILMMRVIRTNAALIIINHTYEDPNAMYPSAVKNMPGGKKLEYCSHVKLQTAMHLVKDGDTDHISGHEAEDSEKAKTKSKFKGNFFRMFCTKNRVAKPGFECTVYVDYEHGIQKWDGLVEPAEAYGFIQPVRGGYIVPSWSDKKITTKELITNDKIWETFIDKLNDASKKEIEYKASNPTAQMIEELEKTLEK